MEFVLPEKQPSTSSGAVLIETETFDFNLPVSPAGRKSRGNVTQESEGLIDISNNIAGQDDEDDDEVYLGPVSYREQCVATRVNLVENPLESGLTAEQYVELFKEANAIALELGGGGQEKADDAESETLNHLAVFKVAESENKLDLSVELNVIVTKSDGEIDDTGSNVNHGNDLIERYKRLTKKNVRSPRRGTYVVDKKQVQAAATAIATNKQLEGQTRPRRLKRPSGGLQKRTTGRVEKAKVPERSKLSLMKPPSSLPNPRATLVDPAALRTNPVDPTRPADEAGRDVLNSSSSSSGSNCSVSSVSSIPSLRKPNPTQRQKLCKLKPPRGKQELLGPKKKSPGIPQPTKGNLTDNNQKKSLLSVPTTKRSLLKPAGATTRSSGLTKPKPASASQRITPPSASIPKRKSQPFRATLTLDKTTKLDEAAPENGRKSMPRPPPTPSTPRGQDRLVLPRKRILSSVSSCSTRTVSRSSLSELDSSVPSTPGGSRRRSFLPTPGKATPARRRSVLPTPTKNSPLSASRVTRSSMSSLRRSSSTVIESPPFKKPAVLREIQSDIFDRVSPNMRTSTPDLKPVKVAKMAAEKKRSNSPAVGMLVDFSDLPNEPVKDPISKTLEFKAVAKENLIDF